MVQQLWESIRRVLKKLNVKLPYDAAIPLLGVYSREMTIYIYTKTCSWMFAAALFIMAKKYKQPRWPSTDTRTENNQDRAPVAGWATPSARYSSTGIAPRNAFRSPNAYCTPQEIGIRMAGGSGDLYNPQLIRRHRQVENHCPPKKVSWELGYLTWEIEALLSF